MYRRILFAVDDDEALPGAIPFAAAYARSSVGIVRVVHVQRNTLAGPPGAGSSLVDSVVHHMQAAGVDASSEVRQVERGDTVAGVITGAAKDFRADLVVIGSHGRSDLAAAFLGSVSHRVVAGLDIPVLVLRPAASSRPGPRKVLVATDGSPASDQSVAEASEVASAFGADVLVLHVQQVITANGAALMEPDSEATPIVDRAVTYTIRRGVKAAGKSVVAARVATAIVAEAEQMDADLIVLGSRRPSDIGGLLLGSVGHEVIHQVRRAVLLARRVPAMEAVH